MSCIAIKNYRLSGLSGSADFGPSDCPSTTTNPPLNIKVDVTLNPISNYAAAVVTLSSPSGSISYTASATLSGSDYVGTLTQSNNVFTVEAPLGNNGQDPPISCGELSPIPQPHILRNVVTLPAGVPGLTGYVAGDRYTIDLLVCNNGQLAIQVEFNRNPQLSINTDLTNGFTNDVCIGCSCIYGTSTCGTSNCRGNVCQNVAVPKIQIVAQTKIDGSDMAEALFIICDEFNYDEGCEIPNNMCRVRYIPIDEIVQTRFDECCPYMVSVVRGRGATLREKLEYIYARESTRIGVTFDIFYRRMMLYGMAKYILSKLLFCKFNINFLLGKYNEKFLDKLGQSRFCAFRELFLDCESPVYGYQRYFKSGQRH